MRDQTRSYHEQTWKFGKKNRSLDASLRDVYMPKFRHIFSFGSSHPHPCNQGSRGVDRATSPRQMSPHRCKVSPIRGKKTQNRTLSNRNTGAVRSAMPTVKTSNFRHRQRRKSVPHQTWHGDRGVRTIFAPRKRIRIWRIVSPLGALKIRGKKDPFQLKAPSPRNPLSDFT